MFFICPPQLFFIEWSYFHDPFTRTVRDVMGQYLLSQHHASALHHINTWYSHWRTIIINNRNMTLVSPHKSVSPKKSPALPLLTTNLQQLKKLYISTKQFSGEDKRSLVRCMNRNFPKYSETVLKKILHLGDYHLYSAIHHLNNWTMSGHPKQFKGLFLITFWVKNEMCSGMKMFSTDKSEIWRSTDDQKLLAAEVKSVM